MPKSISIEGIKLEIPQGQASGFSELVIDEFSEFHGLQMFFENPVFGDGIGLDVISPEGVVVKSYSKNTFITGKENFVEIKTTEKDEPAEIYAGYKLRFIYTAIDVNGRKCIVWFRLKK